MYIFEVVTFFSCLLVNQSTQFSDLQDSIYKVHAFHEVFFLFAIRMPTVTKLYRVVAYCEELSPMNMHDTRMEWSCGVTWQIRYISPPAEDAMDTKLARYWLRVRSPQTWPLNKDISTCRRCMDTKVGKVLT